MTTYTVGIAADKKSVHIRIAGALPAGHTLIGTYDHDESDDPLGAFAESHTHFHHVRSLLGRKSWANPANAALFPDNITDMSSIKIYKGWESPPRLTGTMPVITGTAQVGQQLARGAGSWSEGVIPTLTQQWYADGVAIAGATSNLHTVTLASLGKVITCRITGTNAYGVGDSYLMGPTAAVIAA